MLNCEWAQALTRYDCQTLVGLDGGPCLEIGTPFSLPHGSAINLYVTQAALGFVKISDNADTLFQLGGMGLEVWQPARLNTLRDLMSKHHLQIGDKGEVHILARSGYEANAFALSVTGLLSLAAWANDQMENPPAFVDIVAELEPYIIARDPSAIFKPKPHVKGASSTEHTFDFQHGKDLIDIITANANATGAAMRKAGDVQNGPFAEKLSPLIIVDDRQDPIRAMSEIGILGSVTRAMPVSRLLQPLH